MDEPAFGIDDQTWRDVVSAMDRTYAELVDYQELLEKQNLEIEEMRQFMASVLASVSDVLLVVGRDHRIERTGGPIEDVLGLSASASTGTPLIDLVEADQRDALLAVLQDAMRSRDPKVVEILFQTPSGSTPLEVSISARRDQRGRSQGAVLVGRPLGELRNAYRELEASHLALQTAQSQLVSNEKMASLGRLVAGVAHELNNPISFVYANTHALEKYTTRLETYFDAVHAGRPRSELAALRDELRLERTVRNLRSAITGAKEGAERVRDIVDDLRRFSAEGSGEAVDFDLVHTARTAADWVLRGTKSPVTIQFAGLAEAGAHGNPGHIQQIVMNLVQNAVDALEGRDPAEIAVEAALQGAEVQLTVADTGPGIPAEAAMSIFDPFFTTKPVGKGTGLGLSISHKIATDNGGSLTLLRTDATGSTFLLSLPKGETP